MLVPPPGTDTARTPCWPEHDRGTFAVGSAPALMTIRKFPGRESWAVGWQTICHVWLPIGGTIVFWAPTAPTTTSYSLAPELNDAFVMTSVAVPVFVTVSGCMALVAPTSTLPSATDPGAEICGATPRPLTGIVTLPLSGSLLATVMSMFAFGFVGAVGSNVTVNWRVSPAGTLQAVLQPPSV